MIREKNIISGAMYEAEFYPIFPNGRRIPTSGRKAKSRPSSKEQANLNDKNARKKIVLLVNANFGKGDIVVHGTYHDDEMPSSEAECRKHIQNYIRRIKRYRKKEGLPEMKYIYVIEAKVSKKTGLVRYHFHLITTLWIEIQRKRCGLMGIGRTPTVCNQTKKGAKLWQNILLRTPKAVNGGRKVKILKSPKRQSRRTEEFQNVFYQSLQPKE